MSKLKKFGKITKVSEQLPRVGLALRSPAERDEVGVCSSVVEHVTDNDGVAGSIPATPTTRLALASAKARSWFRPLGGLNQPRTFRRVECPERSRGADKNKCFIFISFAVKTIRCIPASQTIRLSEKIGTIMAWGHNGQNNTAAAKSFIQKHIQL